MYLSPAIQAKLNGVINSLDGAEARRVAATTRLINKPNDAEALKTVREMSAYIRDMRDEKEALEAALEAAKREDASESARQRRQDARDAASATFDASEARIKKAAAVDKAIAVLAAALQDLRAANDDVVNALNNYTPRVHRGNQMRALDFRMVVGDSARGNSYIVPALGKALGWAMDGFDIPNIDLRSWLHVKSGPCDADAVEKAAARNHENFGYQIVYHASENISKEPGDA